MTIYNGGVSVNILRHQATQLCQHYKKIFNSQLSSVHFINHIRTYEKGFYPLPTKILKGLELLPGKLPRLYKFYKD